MHTLAVQLSEKGLNYNENAAVQKRKKEKIHRIITWMVDTHQNGIRLTLFAPNNTVEKTKCRLPIYLPKMGENIV